ncbi:MAG: DUF192 domain-containing protein [Phycisphaerales bacterium]|jgi:uncharacterized membrane protein (UPF0127 family)
MHKRVFRFGAALGAAAAAVAALALVSQRRVPPEGTARNPAAHATGTTFATISGEQFRLEIAADERTQAQGLGGRGALADHDGMLFVFPEPEYQQFVMRDCQAPIDVLLLDESLLINSCYAMQPEPPRSAAEAAGNSESEAAYSARLKGYLSLAPVKYAIELKGGAIARLGLKEGQQIHLEPLPPASPRVAEARPD